MVTNALTHGLGLVGDLFLDPGDVVLTPDLLWENYNLCWETRLEATFEYFPFFDEKLTGFNLPAFKAGLQRHRGKKLVVALNFPNNPSGYTPTRDEASAIVAALTAEAEAGTRLVVCVDDAYYGMFYEADCQTESVFGSLAHASENLLAIKVDGGTKEAFVWGLRVGFLTFGVKNGTPAAYKALEDKTAGLIRAYVSNISNPGQSVVLKALSDPDFRAQQAREGGHAARAGRGDRGRVPQGRVRRLLGRLPLQLRLLHVPARSRAWTPTPRGSGCSRTTASGTIALGKTDLRIAFSCLTEAQIPGRLQRRRQGRPRRPRRLIRETRPHAPRAPACSSSPGSCPAISLAQAARPRPPRPPRRRGELGGEDLLHHPRPDVSRPWTKASPAEATGSGVVIEGKRILTNAHVVLYASQVQVQAHQAGDKVSATVEAIAPGIDLAVLKLDDESFFDTHPPLPRARQRCRTSRTRSWPTATRPAAAASPSPRASSPASSSPPTTSRSRACASRSTPPSTPATAAARRWWATR